MQVYDKVVEDVKLQLDDAVDITVTSDIWTSRKTEGYLTLTAHFISFSWELRAVVLNTLRIRDSHTGEKIASEIRSALEHWGISHKVSTIVTDNATNMISAANVLSLRHVPCFAHTLNLVVKDAIAANNEISGVIAKVKAIVSHFHHSAKATDKLQDTQKKYPTPSNKLIIDVDTRWNSKMQMLRRYVEQHEPVTATLCLLSKKDMCVSADDVALMTTTVEALEPFELATAEMSSESEATLSKMIPIVRMLHGNLSELSEIECPLAVKLQRGLRKRFTALENTYFVAASTILHPCFKRIPFSTGGTQKTEARLLSVLKGHLQIETTEQAPSTSATTDESEPPAKKSLWQKFDKEAAHQRQKSAPETIGAHVEMRRYFEMPLTVRGQDDPLMWWKENEKLFPGLSREAKKLLGIPATSVPAERLFSKAGELVSAKRSCLGESNIDQLLFLNKNL